jgi:DNA polymerase-3 subunit delta
MPEQPLVTLLHGNDEYAIAGHIQRAKAELGDASAMGMNAAQFDGRLGLDMKSLNAALNTLSFMADRRLVVVENPSAGFPAPRIKGKKGAAQARGLAEPAPEEEHVSERRRKFLQLLDHAQPSTGIILAEYEPLSKDPKKPHWLMKWGLERSGGNKADAAKVMIRQYSLPKKWEMPRWIEMQAKKMGGGIQPDAAACLADMLGEEPRIAIQELGKLLTYVPDEQPVSLADVLKVSISAVQGSIFDLVDALGHKDAAKAQRLLHKLLEEQEIQAVWGMILRQFRLLLQARELLDGGGNAFGVKQALHLHEYVAGKVCDQAKQFSLPELEAVHHRLLEMDEAAKPYRSAPGVGERQGIRWMDLDAALDLLVVEVGRK